MGAWMLATRPRTLPAAIAPVVLGSAMAIADKHFAWLPADRFFAAGAFSDAPRLVRFRRCDPKSGAGKHRQIGTDL